MEARRRSRAADPAPARVATTALLRAAADWQLGPRELAAILGLSEATTYRLRSGGRPLDLAAKEGELALLFLRVYRSLDALVGGDAGKARRWLTEPNRHLGGRPLELIATVEGIVRVAGYLDAMRAKV